MQLCSVESLAPRSTHCSSRSRLPGNSIPRPTQTYQNSNTQAVGGVFIINAMDSSSHASISTYYQITHRRSGLSFVALAPSAPEHCCRQTALGPSVCRYALGGSAASARRFASTRSLRKQHAFGPAQKGVVAVTQGHDQTSF